MKEILVKSLQLQMQMKVLHWQTTSYAQHQAFGEFYDVASDLIDKIIESIQGKFVTRIMLNGSANIPVYDMNNMDIKGFISSMSKFYYEDIFTMGLDKVKDSDIDNILQELRGEIDKLMFLLTLK